MRNVYEAPFIGYIGKGMNELLLYAERNKSDVTLISATAIGDGVGIAYYAPRFK